MIVLTLNYGDIAFINPNKIEAIIPMGSESNVLLSSGTSILIKESPEEIVKIITGKFN